MAKDETEDQKNDNEDKKPGSSTMKIIIIVVALIVIIGGGVGGTLYFLGAMDDEKTLASSDGDEDGEESKPSAPPQYLSMDPKFIVSFGNQSKARFMQFSLEVMSRNAEVIEQIEAHMPVIRSSLLMLFGTKGYEEMITREGKEKLLSEATADINTSLQKLLGKTELLATVEAAYFNTFVIQ